ncbi:hypothetical protein [Actinoplanes rectilineatus]|uniref:hypothetical protein n=1 Tax=Actinoplanes rectilineatus TaxID=113571 RepID=UPI000698AF6D|nr:hypothetical protein [Actinoplanes rectilineatus]
MNGDGLFDPLIGTWRTRIHYLTSGREVDGDWEFGPALDGRAVLDVWRVPSATVPVPDADREVGLCVRIWDPRLRLWRFTFHSTATTTVISMYARAIGSEIILERAVADRIERWVFSSILPDTFAWRSDVSVRGGEWSTVQTLTARRT